MGENGIWLKEFEEILKTSFIEDGRVKSELLPNFLPLPRPTQEELVLVSSGLVNRLSTIDNGTAIVFPNDTKSIHPVLPECKLEKITLDEAERIHTQYDYVPWPFNLLPESVGLRSYGHDSALSSSNSRALRKELQVQSMLRCILPLIPQALWGPNSDHEEISSNKRFCIVDFAGGTGTLAITLALLFPQCDIIDVDLKVSSLFMVHQKTQVFAATHNQVEATQKDVESIPNNRKTRKKRKKPKPPNPLKFNTNNIHVDQRLHRCEHVPNLYTYYGSIEAFSTDAHRPTFDLGLCLHGCGEASDLVLRACGDNGANFVVCPCCVGKLNRQRCNPYIFQATTENVPTVLYPQSQAFRNILTAEQFDVLAKAGDYSEYRDIHSSKYASRRIVKGIIEMDRLLFMKERYGYDHAVLTKMEPFDASPKNDILLGWKSCPSIRDPYELFGGVELVSPCDRSNSDIQRTFHRVGLESHSNSTSFKSSEWTEIEENDIRSILQSLIESSELVYTFSCGMGPRLRKLVHVLASELGLNHWTQERAMGEKAVVVEKCTKSARAL